ncbi:unnamed protein product [Brachionus calyciflorus]|uniref:EGF-like domain-containing protein n=1 Tax=Brachionus calyciflorus TaxID=104777 RepID=A0A814KXC3_9BILA|nr:unnamed protein product [Brachionus calyciflorus]
MNLIVSGTENGFLVLWHTEFSTLKSKLLVSKKSKIRNIIKLPTISSNYTLKPVNCEINCNVSEEQEIEFPTEPSYLTSLDEKINLTITTKSTIIPSKNQMSISDFPIWKIVDILSKNIDFHNCMLNCSNNGLCLMDSNFNYECVCSSYYTGLKCQYDTRLCSSNPCLNKGVCVEGNNTYSCLCSDLYFGQNCEFKNDVCQNETCNGNGVCKDVRNEPFCECLYLFSGKECEIKSEEIQTIKRVVKTSSIIYAQIVSDERVESLNKELEQLSIEKNPVKANALVLEKNSYEAPVASIEANTEVEAIIASGESDLQCDICHENGVIKKCKGTWGLKLHKRLFLPALINAQTLNKFQWSDCGSVAISFLEADVTPMPIVQPGNVKLVLAADLKRALSGSLTTSLSITRTVSGLKLPIRCYLAAGVYVGSCTYDDMCKVVATLLPSFTPETCPPSLADLGIDCTCPFKLKAGLLEIEELFEVPDANSTIFSFLASGDFEVKIEAKDALGPSGCINIKFAVKPK